MKEPWPVEEIIYFNFNYGLTINGTNTCAHEGQKNPLYFIAELKENLKTKEVHQNHLCTLAMGQVDYSHLQNQIREDAKKKKGLNFKVTLWSAGGGSGALHPH